MQLPPSAPLTLHSPTSSSIPFLSLSLLYLFLPSSPRSLSIKTREDAYNLGRSVVAVPYRIHLGSPIKEVRKPESSYANPAAKLP